MLFVDALQSIISILFMIFLGYYLTHISWFNEKSATLFSRLIINISLPALILYNLMTGFTKDRLLYMWSSLTIPLIGLIISYLIGKIVAKIIGIPKDEQGLFSALFTFSNTVFMGIPVNLALFGEESLSIVTIYYIAHTTFFWTVGIYGIKKDKGNIEGSVFSLQRLKNIFSPVLLSYLIVNLLIFFEVNLPNFVLDTANYLSSMTTPLSMFFLGISLYGVEFNSLKFDKKLVAILLGTFLITPAAVYMVLHFAGRPSLMQKVFVLEAAMPVMGTTPIVAKVYGRKHKYAALIVGLTTLLSIFIIPLYLLFLSG